MTNPSSIFSNALEDSVEDLLSNFIFDRNRQLTEGIKKEYESDSTKDEFIQNFVTTLGMGLSIYALNLFMNFFFERGIKYLTAMYSYIIAGKVKNFIANKLNNSSLKGKKGFRYLGLILGTDRQSDRIEMMKIVQSNIDSYDNHKFHHENRHLLIQGQVDNYASKMANYSGTKDTGTLTLFTDLTNRGAWQNTTEHRRIYEKATGYKLSQTGSGSWSKLYQELNKFTQYHKTVEGDVDNLTKSISKLVATKGS